MPTSQVPKLIAFYLPQFHPIAENDAWWGKGFTEWRNVARARPLFRGHYQPHLPADLGFYDLRLDTVRDEQAELAKRYGIHGFCYYYYWFNGKKLLDRPLREVVELGKPDFKFCLCWANENWSRRWDGSEQEVLIAQEHSPQSDEQFILDVIPILKDPRYIRVSGKPMLLVYRVDLLPWPDKTAARWRRIAAASGIPDLHLCAVQSFGTTDPRPFGFDAAVEFPPHGLGCVDVEGQVSGITRNFTGTVFDYRDAANWMLSKPVPDYQLHRGLMVSWDNSPRWNNRAYIYTHATPANYYEWLQTLVRDSRTRAGASEFVFINAWNEWAEGAHLEPDLKHGHAYLEATRRALVAESPIEAPSLGGHTRNDGPLVSVVIWSHNHVGAIRDAIASVESQTYANIELVVVDDGSSDSSVSIIEKTLSDSRLRRVTFRTQPDLGATVSLDRGVALSTGDYVAFLNADAAFAPRRVEALVQGLSAGLDVFLFSRVSFSRDPGKGVIDNHELHSRMASYEDALRLVAATPTIGFALLASNLAVSTSNFFFNRGLFDRLGGFSNRLPLVHDWDFVLRATRYVEPRFIPDQLLICRYRAPDAAAQAADQQLVEGRTVLARFTDFANEATLNEVAPTRRNWPLFFDFFCSTVRPWFATGPLVAFMPQSRHDRAARANGRIPHARDRAAVQRLQRALQDNWFSAAAVAGPHVAIR